VLVEGPTLSLPSRPSARLSAPQSRPTRRANAAAKPEGLSKPTPLSNDNKPNVSPGYYKHFNGSKNVQALDYNAFRSAFGKSSGHAGYDAVFDFDNSGAVNALDYNQFRGRFGKAFTY
jgi:hypothetical protein